MKAHEVETDLPSDASRDTLGVIFCRGQGLEIGAGTVPTATHSRSSVRYADKRNDAELRRYFGRDDAIQVEDIASLQDEQFDFLIAHHVLEHSANVIETLVQWVSMLRNEGILFISLPNRHQTPDNLRLLTPPTHFLLDYVHGTTEDDFESREHVCSFLWSWIDVGGLAGKTKLEASGLVAAALQSESNDLHWHTFNVDTMRFVVDTAAAMLGLGVEALHVHDGFANGSEHRGVFRFSKGGRGASPRLQRLMELRKDLRSLVYGVALEGLEGCATHALSREHRGKIFVAQDAKLRWVTSPDTLGEMGLDRRDYTLLEITDREEGFLDDPIGMPVVDRKQEIARRLSGVRGERGIELSPGSHPLLDKPRFNVLYLDKTDHTLAETYLTGTPLQVDLVLGDRLIDEVLEHNSLAYIVSSHVIEHVPDFIQFFISASRVLKPGGQIVMYVPDKRYTFDVLRKVSEVTDVEAAHSARLRSPTREMFIDAHANSDFQAEAAALWNGSYRPSPARTIEEATRIADNADLGNADVHCFVFTPTSMRALLEHVRKFYVPRLEILAVEDTKQGACEFIVELQIATE